LFPLNGVENGKAAGNDDGKHVDIGGRDCPNNGGKVAGCGNTGCGNTGCEQLDGNAGSIAGGNDCATTGGDVIGQLLGT
jgi:hypothetical protein